MIKRILIAVSILLAPIGAYAQGACYPAGVVLLDTGRPANGASIRVCTAGSTGTPCTPTASLFTDPTLGTPLGGSPVVIADAHGNFGFCAAAGNNYDLQISGTGITTLTIRNLPLPPTSPINAASLTSSTANPANVGQIKLASIDCLDWRNNANTGNIQLCKNTSDQLDLTAFPGIVGASLVSPSTTGTDSGTETLSNKTLTSPTVTNPSTTGTDSGTETLNNKTLTSPTSTGTDSGTETLKSKTLGGTGSTAPHTPYNRLKANQGTALASGDFAFSSAATGFGSWGTTASVTNPGGTDAAGFVSVICSGTGQTANPAIKLTFHDGVWPTLPIPIVSRADGNSPSGIVQWFAVSTTSVTFGLPGTCSAGNTYSFSFAMF